MDPLLEGAKEVAARLVAAGHEAYFAGGCVRDAVLGVPPKDYDIVTDATPDVVMRLFRRTVNVGASFGVVRALWKGDLEYEIATYRRDGDYTDGRHPSEVEYSKSKEEDVQRRDFTINALLMDPRSGEVLDFVGGRADLAAGIVRAVGDPARRFAEDRLRMLRAIRFAARFGFEIEPATFAALSAHAASIVAVSVERIVTELHAMWATPRPGTAARDLVRTGLLGHVLAFVRDEARFLERAGRLADATAPLAPHAREVVAWAATIADAPDAEGILRGFKLSRDHLRGALGLLAIERDLLAPAALPIARRVRLAAREDFDTLRAFAAVIGAPLAVWEDERAALARDPLPPMPLLSGADLRALGYPPGPRYAAILETVADAAFERRARTRQEAIELVRREYPVDGA